MSGSELAPADGGDGWIDEGTGADDRVAAGSASRWLKLTATVMMTGTARPAMTVGVNSHCFTASAAAALSAGIDRTTLVLLTRPFASIVASITTVPVGLFAR